MTTPPSNADPLDLLICSTCGTQFPETSGLTACKICDDPRQFVPPTGQSWTTLSTLRSEFYKNIFTPDPIHCEKLVSIHTEPRLAIGQRAYLCRTNTNTKSSTSRRSGSSPDSTFNILWDCITYIDDATINEINKLGGIHAIVISHPHFYTTHLVWAEIFDCPVYLSSEDEEWVVLKESENKNQSQSDEGKGRKRQVFFSNNLLSFTASTSENGNGIYEGDDGRADIVAIKAGGHFPGSTVLLWRSLKTLLIADTMAVVPSGKYWVDRPAGTASFTFMWSYPNMIPLSADDVHGIWKAIKHTVFDITRGAFVGMDTDTDSKKRMLDSAQIFVKSMGYLGHAIHQEKCL
ncbi:putative metallo-beta-lactamase domain protein [Aspergillus undulatus]|uniref:putative metallo-beta-lactamase domain protein n=1 Tax=Aspergillus undulatus TaxID=1810928 RepID=UPI003CCE28D1